MNVTFQKALIIFKPDAVALGQCVRGMRLLAAKLQQAGVNFRFTAPQLLAAAPALVNAVYPEHVGKSWYEQRHLPFMSGSHPDPLVKQAPLFTTIIEADEKVSNLFDLLRQDHIVGPTNPERVLAELEANEPRAKQVMQSVRYLLTLGSGARVYLLHRQDNSPLNNRLHCSASLAEANLELLASYGTVQSMGSLAIPFKPPLLESRASGFLASLAAAGFVYRDFGELELKRLIFEFNRLIPLLELLDRNFQVNIRKKLPQPITAESIRPPQKPPAVLIGISGPPGSGKTTIATALMERLGLKSVTHVTSYRAEAEAPVGEEYLYLPENLFMEMLAQGELVGASQFREWGKYYSVLRASLDELSLRGGTAVMVCGANTLAAVREHLRGSNVVFRTILVAPPTLADTRTRHEGRARPGDEVRYAKLASVGQRILDRAAEFDFRVVNDDLEAVIAQAVRYAQRTIAGEAAETASPPEVITTPQQLITEYVWRRFYNLLQEKRGRIRTESPEAINQSIKELYEEGLTQFLAEVRREIRSLPHLSKTDQAVVKEVTEHTLGVFLSAVLAAQPAPVVTRSTDFLGRLAEHGAPGRVNRNLGRIRKLALSIPAEDRDVIALLHDVGKPKDFFFHHLHSDTLIERYRLLDALDSIPPERKPMIKMAIKYHLAIGCLAFSIFSLITTRNMFADPEVRESLTNPDGSLNLEKTRIFLDYLLFITIADVAGRVGKRGIRNLIVEAYFRWHARIGRFAVENQTSYDAFLGALAKNAAKYNFERLSGKTASADIEMDLKREGWTFHDRALRRARDRALREGIFSSADWAFLLDNLQYVTDEWYTPLSFFARVDSERGQILDRIPAEMNVNLLKFMILSLRIASQNIPNFGPSQTFAFAFTGRDESYLTKMPAMRAAAVELDKIMKKTEGFIREGEEIFFVDGEGRKIEDIKISIAPASPESVLNVNFKNIS